MNLTIEGGTSKRLLTAGKYCPEDIVVTAEGGTSVFATDDGNGNITLTFTNGLTGTDDGSGNVTIGG